MPLVLATAPTTEPVTVDEAKSHMRITHTEEDALIGVLITSARKYCEDVTGRSFINTTWDLYTDTFPAEFLIYKVPLVSISYIKYYNTSNVLTTLDSGEYQADITTEPARIKPDCDTSWPTTKSGIYKAVNLRFVSGYGTLPANVPEQYRLAIKILVAHWYENRELMITGAIATDVQYTLDALLMADRSWQF